MSLHRDEDQFDDEVDVELSALSSSSSSSNSTPRTTPRTTGRRFLPRNHHRLRATLPATAADANAEPVRESSSHDLQQRGGARADAEPAGQAGLLAVNSDDNGGPVPRHIHEMLQQRLNSTEIALGEANRELRERDAYLDMLKSQIDAMQRRHASYESVIAHREATIRELQKECSKLTEREAELEAREQILEATLRSRAATKATTCRNCGSTVSLGAGPMGGSGATMRSTSSNQGVVYNGGEDAGGGGTHRRMASPASITGGTNFVSGPSDPEAEVVGVRAPGRMTGPGPHHLGPSPGLSRRQPPTGHGENRLPTVLPPIPQQLPPARSRSSLA